MFPCIGANNYTKTLFKVIIIITISLYTTIANASCTGSKDVMLDTQGILDFEGPADSLYVGQQLKEGWAGNSTDQAFTGCSGKHHYISTANSNYSATGIVSIIDGVTYPVFETGVKGIGVIIGIKDPLYPQYVPLDDTPTTILDVDKSLATIGFDTLVSYVATGALKTGSYNIPSSNVAKLELTSDGNIGAPSVQLVLQPITINITAHACEVVGGNFVNINVGDWYTDDFNGVGSSTTPQPIDLSLNCQGELKLNAKITAEEEQSFPGAIKLQNGEESSATGVAIQMLNNFGAPLTLNSKFNVANISSNTVYDLGWSVRYIQTLDSVSAGSANAMATLTLTYE